MCSGAQSRSEANSGVEESCVVILETCDRELAETDTCGDDPGSDRADDLLEREKWCCEFASLPGLTETS